MNGFFQRLFSMQAEDLNTATVPIMTVDEDGTKQWHLNGEPHREDGPAVETVDGAKEWWLHGVRHRDDGPAIETAKSREWWVNGKLHREDGPAVEREKQKSWWLNGQQHRTDGPAWERTDGSRQWWVNGVLHREDGPAIENANGNREWWVNGLLHRDDGPAVINPDGSFEWRVNGREPDAAEIGRLLERIQQKLARAEQKKAAELHQALREVFTQGVTKPAAAPKTARFKPRELRLQK
jgi:hypothetical protein